MTASKCTPPPIITSTNYDIQTYETPPSLTKMANIYGPSFHILGKSGYNGNGCGAYEQGIKVPLENNAQETSFVLGYNPLKTTKASKISSISVNVIFSSASLSLKHPK